MNNICLELVNNNNCDPLSLLKSNMNKWIHKEKYKKFELTKVKPKQVRKSFKLLKLGVGFKTSPLQ